MAGGQVSSFPPPGEVYVAPTPPTSMPTYPIGEQRDLTRIGTIPVNTLQNLITRTDDPADAEALRDFLRTVYSPNPLLGGFVPALNSPEPRARVDAPKTALMRCANCGKTRVEFMEIPCCDGLPIIQPIRRFHLDA